MPSNDDRLLRAIRRYSDVATVRRLIIAGANVNVRDERGTPAVSLAAARLLVRVVQELVQHGADVNALDTIDKTPIEHALIAHSSDWQLTWQARQSAQLAIVDALLSGGAAIPHDANGAPCDNWLLLWAKYNHVAQGCASVARRLVAAGCATQYGAGRLTPMHYAHNVAVAAELASLGCAIDLPCGGAAVAQTPLMRAVACVSVGNECARQMALIQFFLACGASVPADIWARVAHADAQCDTNCDIVSFWLAAAALPLPENLSLSGDQQVMIAKSAHRLGQARVDLWRFRGAQICVALQSLSLPDLQLVEIVDAACPLAQYTPYHTRVQLINAVKHFREGGQRAAAEKRAAFLERRRRQW